MAPTGGSHRSGDRKGKRQSTAYKKGERSMRKFAISGATMFGIKGDVCPVNAQSQSFRVVHRKNAHTHTSQNTRTHTLTN